MLGNLEHVLLRMLNIDDSVITCNKIIMSTKTVPRNFNDKKTTCR